MVELMSWMLIMGFQEHPKDQHQNRTLTKVAWQSIVKLIAWIVGELQMDGHEN